MTDDFDREIRSALAVMVAEAPDPLSFGDLARETASPRTSRSQWSPGKAFAVGFAAVVVAVGAVALALGAVDGGSAPADEVPTTVATLPPETVTTLPPETLSLSGWFRIPHDADVFGEARMHSVVAGGPGLVAVGWTGSSPSEGHVDGDAAVWTSVDGITWEPIPSQGNIFTDGQMARVIVGGPGLVAVGNVEGDDDWAAAIWTSSDGTTWTRVPHDEAVLGQASMQDVTVGGPGLVAVGNDSNGAAVWTSADGISWSRVPPSDSVASWDGEASMTAVTVGGPGLVAVGGLTVWTSPDGINWSKVPDVTAFAGGPEGYPRISTVTAGGPGLVAVGWVDHHAAVWTSPDGVAWSRVPHDDGIFGESWTSMSDVIDIGSGLIAVGANNGQAAVWSSLDGVAWSRVPHDETLFGAPISTEQLGQAADQGVRYGITAVAAGPSGLVAVGLDGKVNGPPSDSIVWTAMPGNGP